MLASLRVWGRSALLVGSLGLSLASAAGCTSSEKNFFEPGVVLHLSLPTGLDVTAVPCLDLVLHWPTGTPPRTIGFGGNPFVLRVQTRDQETRIRFIKGSTPFLTSTTSILITPGEASGAAGDATFTVGVTARAADGRVSLDDQCLEGTVLAQGSAETDAQSRAIRFPASGNTLVEIPLGCVDPGGCGSDGGAGSSPRDGGTADGG